MFDELVAEAEVAERERVANDLAVVRAYRPDRERVAAALVWLLEHRRARRALVGMEAKECEPAALPAAA